MAGYTKEELAAALKQAHTAGDTKAAEAIAARINTMIREGGSFDDANRAAVESGADPIDRQQYEAAVQHSRNNPGSAEDYVDYSERPSVGGQLLDSTKNAAAGIVQGITAIPDAVTEALAGATRYASRPVSAGLSGIAEAAGMSDVAGGIRDWQQTFERGLSQPATLGGMIEDISPTPEGGGAARFVSQLAGGGFAPYAGLGKSSGISDFLKRPASSLQNAAAKEVVEEGGKRGVPVMTTDVAPPKTGIGKNARMVGEKIPFIGTGGPRAAQQEKRVAAVSGLLDEYNVDVGDLFTRESDTIGEIAKSLGTKRSADIDRLTGQKTGIIDGLAQAGEVPLFNTTKALDDKIAELTKRGTDPALQVAETLKAWRTQWAGKTIDQVEAIRADELSGAFKGDNSIASINNVGRKAVKSLYGPLVKDMGAFIKAKGGNQAEKTWSQANASLSEMAGELGDTAFKKALRTTDMTPENVGLMLFNRPPSTVRRLVRNLPPEGKNKAKAALLERAVQKSTSLGSGISVERFTNNLDAMSERIGVVFGAAEAQGISRFVNLMNATRQASTASAAPLTGAQNTPTLIAGGLGVIAGKLAIPIAATGGLLARVYESAPVRNKLIGLSKTKPGSAAERKLMQGILGAMRPFMDDPFITDEN